MPQRIEDYAVVGDMQTAALVGRDGSVDWLCFPRFDSGACFAALLGDERNGCWLLAPVDEPKRVRRAYRGDTLILETVFETATGTVKLVDFMPPRGREPDLIRIVEGVSGRVRMRMDLRIRFDYGARVPWVRRRHGALQAVSGPDGLTLHTPVPTKGKDLTTVAEFEVGAGDRIPFTLTWWQSYEPAPDGVDALRALAETERFWHRWAARCTYSGRWRDAVMRSLLTLKALQFAPSGGIVAAATTSLPEDLGGVRNWDYRYCWLRDSTMTLTALLMAGYEQEAKAWREWLLRAVGGDPANLQIMYGVGGEPRMAEQTLPWLAGYEGSAPVRVGNAAVDQFQLDVYGEVIDSLYQARGLGVATDQSVWSLQRALLDYLEGIWKEPDEGLWEVRGPRRHFTHSKVLAWVALDRAVKTVERDGLEGPVERWRALRDEIHAEVCAKAWDADRQTFTQAFGTPALDASLLLIPMVGFLPAKDPRVAGTVAAIERELCVDGFPLRYPTDGGSVDGLPGDEGVFLACSFWLADNYALLGRRKDATTLFERLLALRNDVGLLSEEYDPRHGRLVGNFPQAFSHVPLISTAMTLAGGRHPTGQRSRGSHH